MEFKTFFIQDRNGVAQPGAEITVYLAGTNTLATGLLDSANQALPNPALADANGLIQFYAPDGAYDLSVVSGERAYTLHAEFLDVQEQVQAASGHADRAEVARNEVEQTLAVYTMDPLRRSVESASGGRMTVLYTAKGEPCYMHVLPKFNLEDVDPTLGLGSGVHPAFIKGGTELTELFIGAYQAKVAGGEALSQPMQDPSAYVNYDQAKAYCAANGPGWHLMTNWEWAAIAVWCMANGYEPLGNTNYGRHHDQRFQTGRRQDGAQPGLSSGAARTLTGSGPADWSHDKTPAGIHDLVGNVWEWQGGLKLQDGRVVMPIDNDWDADELAWVAQDLWFSSGSTSASTSNLSLVTAEVDVVRNGVVGDNANSGSSDYKAPWSSMVVNGEAPEIAKQALIAPAGIAPVGQVYARTYGERLPIRGGSWNYAGLAGLAALYLYGSRASAGGSLGFRPAFGL